MNDRILRTSSGLNGLIGPTTIKSERSGGISSLVRFRSSTSQPTLLKRDFQLPIPRPRGFKSLVEGSPCPTVNATLVFWPSLSRIKAVVISSSPLNEVA